jgi:hypothetical protein
VAFGGCNDFFERILVHPLRRLTAIHQVVYQVIGLAFIILHAQSMRFILNPGAPFQINGNGRISAIDLARNWLPTPPVQKRLTWPWLSLGSGDPTTPSSVGTPVNCAEI